jgi:TolB-like protein/DNA-binding winged helix-turn-helix (wHTH) protein
MKQSVPDRSRVAAEFDGWTLARQPLELWRDGQRLRLQDLPLQILDLLVSRRGELVTREALTARLWPTGVVDFDAGLNTAMRKLRVALGDVGDTPRYIETVPRQGYRFVGELASSEAPPVELPRATARPRRKPAWIGLSAVLLACIAIAVWRNPKQPATPPHFRIAVLPFENLSSDPAIGFFTDGIHEEILSTLAGRAPDLEVISRTTMMLYRATPKPVTQIAKELGVTHVLEGTVRREGDQVRVTLQLVDARSDHQLWMESFDRTLADAMTLQTEVATQVTNKLALRLTTNPARPAPPDNPEAYDLWLRANLAWQNVGNASLSEILRIEEMYTRAIALDDKYAAAYADRARVRIVKLLSGFDESAGNIEGARADVRNARQLAGGTPLVLVREASIAYLVDGDLDRALELIAEAERAGPLNADQTMTKANFHAHHGDLDVALPLFERAATLDPGNATNFRFWSNALFTAHRPAEAMRVAEQFEARLPGRINFGALLFSYTGAIERWRADVARLNATSEFASKLDWQFELLRFERRYAEMAALLDHTDQTMFREHNAYGNLNLFGASLKPVAELRGWERLMAGDAKGTARAGEALSEFVRTSVVTSWNAWWMKLIEAEAALFKGNKAQAAAHATSALTLLRKYPGSASSIYARSRAARILAWAGSHDQALDLLQTLATQSPGIGPAEIVRDPLIEIPLRENARYREMAGMLESAIAQNQALAR